MNIYARDAFSQGLLKINRNLVELAFYGICVFKCAAVCRKNLGKLCTVSHADACMIDFTKRAVTIRFGCHARAATHSEGFALAATYFQKLNRRVKPEKDTQRTQRGFVNISVFSA